MPANRKPAGALFPSTWMIHKKAAIVPEICKHGAFTVGPAYVITLMNGPPKVRA
jgi:hypothetical protein